MNIAEIESSLKELVEAPFAPTEFVFKFIEIYDAPKSTVTKLRQAAADDLFGVGMIWKKKLFFRVAEKGDSAAAVDAMRSDPLVRKQDPRFFMATDGIEVIAYDTKLDQSCDAPFRALNDSFDFFLPLAGIERYQGVAESPADIKATGRLAKLYDAILESNPDWTGMEAAHHLNIFMTRMLFCLFAEDTSIFESGLFTQTMATMTREDGGDTASVLETLFLAMDTPETKRKSLPEFARRFPYVNGGLFRDRAPIPQFNRRARRLLKDCGALHWSVINPDIFGSMIQAVVEPGMRGDMGMHYTSVPNIMKVLHPLFLMSLEEDFEASRDSQAKLQKLLGRIYGIRIFDPACGSGNFLIISYRELRRLESRIFERLREIGQRSLPMTGVSLSQFYGIELADFACETAKLSLWIAEYQMNAVFQAEFGTAPAALPLRDAGNIVHANSLRHDWLQVCPRKDGSETYVVGNPPYLGSTYQTNTQKEDMTRLFAAVSKSYKNLDYVAAWYLKAADYGAFVDSQAAFVATNSICQGEQVDMLWPLMFKRGVEISFAHQSFKWRNNASHVAGVTCVIVGIRRRGPGRKTLYSGDLARQVRNIGPYLLEMDDTIVSKEAFPINGLLKMDWGNKPTDDGNLILSPEEKEALLAGYPKAASLVKRLYGSQEFIKGIERWCLWISDQDRDLAESIPPIKARIEAVKAFRAASIAEQTREYAVFPHRFRQIQNSGVDAIIVPRLFSENRRYFTIGFCEGATSIITDLCYAIYDGQPYLLSILSSRLHAVWVSAVCGQLETRIRYSNTMGYHTFPMPALSSEQCRELDDHAWAIIAARDAHPGKTIAWLYDQETMPDNILRAHQALDETIERICIGRPFKSDTERLEHLFRQYAVLKKRTRAQDGRELAFKGKS
jgi:hypothetical protein